MATFGRKLASQSVDRVARLQTMADMPFTLTQNLGEQFKQGIVDSFGLGTVVREGMTPQGNTVPDARPSLIPNPAEALGRLAQNVGGMIRGGETQPSLNEDEYKSSPYFREDIPFEQGMTEDRAAALAMFYDTKKVREYFGEKRPFSTFIGQLGGQALDPINYVPVFGQAAEVAAVARLGTIAGRALIGAGDAAINTAAFGLMTSRMRDEFGDDTSWQAMTSEIAMSALIGGAFGGGIGAFTARREWNFAREDASRSRAYALTQANKSVDGVLDIRSLKESRAVLNEGVGDMAAGRDVTLSPNGQAVVERIQTAVTRDATAARSLADQTATISADAKVVITPSGSRVEIVPEVVELDSLVNASGALQVRNRSTQASAVQVEQIATELDPARLMTSVDADSGAPIVGADNVIDSGNGRVMALRRAAEAYPDRYNAYKKALADAGHSIDGMNQPVLISRRVTNLSDDARAKFNAEANAPRAAQMSAVELAAMDRNALDGTLDVLDASPVTSPGNRAFVQRFLGNLAPSARDALIDGAGNINADGVRRIENALVAEAYGDVDIGVLRRFAEATDDNTRSIVGAMSDVAGKWALMRRDVTLGNISPEFDMTAELTEALRLIGGWREQAGREGRPVSQVIREGMAQLDLLSGEISPETQALVSAFYQSNSFARAAGRDTIAELLSRIVDAAEELGRPQLFGDIETTRMEVLRYAASNEQGNLFTPNGADDGIEADGGFDRGTSLAANRQGAGQGSRPGSIAERMTQRFEAAGRPADEARATAELVDAFYAQQAARLGLTVDELEAQFGLPEVRQAQGEFPGAALAQSPQSPAFREWFGDSRVVDAKGEPMVVYHGGAAGIEAFESASWRYRDFMVKDARASVVNANFFAADRAVSQSYVAKIEGQRFRDSDPAGQMYEVYLKLENPLQIDWKGKRFTTGDPSKLIDQAKAGGHDGLMVSNVIDDYRQKGKPTTIYVTFAGEQIKSVNNRGTFDPNDPSILNQPAYHGTPHLFDTFSTEKIGTGEGAQAYGWGLYFSSSKDVATWYRDTLTDPDQVPLEFMGRPVDEVWNDGILERWSDLVGNMSEAQRDDFTTVMGNLSQVNNMKDVANVLPNFTPSQRKMYKSLVEPKLLKPETGAGRLFEVDVPSDDELVDWDAKLSEQPPAVRAKLAALGLEPKMTKGARQTETATAERAAFLNGRRSWELSPEDQKTYNSMGFEPVEFMSDPKFSDAYEEFAREKGSDAAASAALREAGIPGHRYVGTSSDATNYVLYDDSRVQVRSFEQGGDNPRGAIQLGDTNIISLFETSDASTALHETGHLFLSMLKGMGEKGDAPDDIKADWESVREWWRGNADAVAADANASGRAAGVTGKNVIDALDLGTTGDAAKDRAIDVGMQEQWARGFEAYVREGNAPTAGLARAFEQFRQWLTAIYRRATDLNVNLSPEIRQVFDNLLGSQEPARRAVPSIDGKPVRVTNPDAPAPAEPATTQASLMLNEPDNAAARVGKDETMRDIALSHGVDPTTGGFVEAGDVAQLREEGRLTAEDEAELAEADQLFADSEAYGRALEAAVACII